LILSHQSQKFSSSTCGEVWQSKMKKQIVENLPREYTVCQKMLYRTCFWSHSVQFTVSRMRLAPLWQVCQPSAVQHLLCTANQRKIWHFLGAQDFQIILHGPDCIAPLKRSLHTNLVEYCPFSVNLQWCPLPNCSSCISRCNCTSVRRSQISRHLERTATVRPPLMSWPVICQRLSHSMSILSSLWNGRKRHKEPNQQWTSLPAN